MLTLTARFMADNLLSFTENALVKPYLDRL
jgi:hypothetical protein